MSIGLQRAHSLPVNAVETYLSSTSTSVTLTGSSKVALINASTASVTVTLPAPKNGLTVNIKKIDSSTNAVIIAPASGTIDGAASKSMSSQYDSLTITSDGVNYFLIERSLPDPIVSTYSGAHIPSGSSLWYNISNNSITIPSAGTWNVNMVLQARNNGTNPQYSRVHALIGATNGANSVTQPTFAGSAANVISIVGATDIVQDPPGSSDAPDWDLSVSNCIVKTSGPVTFYGNAFTTLTTPANATYARLYVSLWAWRIG